MIRPIIFIGFISLIFISILGDYTRYRYMGALLLWMCACLAIGAALGFLFGVPKTGLSTNGNKDTQMGTQQSSQTRPNTNLEEISDWLTKIIVGLTLVNVKTIGSTLWQISEKMALVAGKDPSGINTSVSLAILITFLTAGFLNGYFCTRLFLQQIFIFSDRKLTEIFNAVLSNPTPNVAPAGSPVIPSKAEISNAEQLAKLAQDNPPETVSVAVNQLASEYKQTREEMEKGDERLQRMSAVASRLRQFGKAALFMLPALTKSQDPGEKLAAVNILQMCFKPEYINFLASIIAGEQGFTAYQAASALYVRLIQTDTIERIKIQNAVKDISEKYKR
jgi:hypothetical protein